MNPKRTQTHTQRRKKSNPPPPGTFLTDRTLVGEALKRLRAASHETDHRCASRAGVSLETWRRWESGEEWPDDEQISHILEALETSAERFDLQVLSIMMERLEAQDSVLHDDPNTADDPSRLLTALKITAQSFYTITKELERMVATGSPAATLRRKADA